MESAPDLGQGRKGSWASWGSEQSPERPREWRWLFSCHFPSSLRGDLVSHLYFSLTPFQSPFSTSQFVLPPRTHSENGHASSLLYVLVPGPVVTDQKARVPIPDAVEKTLVVSAWVRSIYSNNLWALGVIVTPGARPCGRDWGKLLGKEA